MAKRRSSSATRQAIKELPEVFLDRILPRAARAGAEVIADDARAALGGRRAETGGGAYVLIADSVKVKVKREGTLIRARIYLDGPGAYVGRWLEYGTDPHFITIDPTVRKGMTARRVNAKITDGDGDLKATLLINGKPVGTSVYHPGAQAKPFLRPALDNREGDAIAAMQGYVTSRATRAGIAGAAASEIDP